MNVRNSRLLDKQVLKVEHNVHCLINSICTNIRRWHLDLQQEMVLLRDEAKGMISKIDFK